MNTIYLSKTIILTNIIRTKEKCLEYYQNLSFNTKDKVTIIVNIIKTSTKIRFQLDLKFGLGALVSHFRGGLFLLILKRSLCR